MVKNKISSVAVLLSLLLAVSWTGSAHAQPLVPITKIESPRQLNYTMALLRDRRGPLWVGTEGEGVWRYDPSVAGDDAWKQFAAKDGLGDNFCYSLAQDWQGRIWVGHAAGGVSVYNGRDWANYDVIESSDRVPPVRSGPLASRIFNIAVNPANGEVWLATSAGISIYAPATDSWRYLTTRDGLPSDQIQAIAFDSVANVYVGSQCEGLAIGRSASNYTEWKVVPGQTSMPDSAAGSGLPSSQISDIFVTDDDIIYVSSKVGLTRSSDLGESWSFIRGIDWEGRVKGRTKALVPKPLPDGFNKELLREDFITNFSEGDNGLLYIGYRIRGWEARRPLTDRVVYRSAKNDKDSFSYVSSLITQTGGPAILGFYRGGIQIGEAVPDWTPNGPEKVAIENRRNWKAANLPALPQGIVNLPASAKAPTFDEIDELLKPLANLKDALPVGQALYEGDDWQTKGDWVGRYGREYAVLCAMRAPLDHYVTSDSRYLVEGFIGPHARRGDSLRHWVHWGQTENKNTLYDPIIGYRRQAEWDDHGETYPYEWEGPDVWAKVTVPAGVHRMSLYFFNKDGLYNDNRARDYLLEVKPGNLPLAEADSAPPLARARVRDFWNGVHKRFLVNGPAQYWVKVGRDGSFNTILSSVMLDKISGPASRSETRPLAFMGRLQYRPQAWDKITYAGSPQTPTVTKARTWDWKLDSALGRQGGQTATSGLRILALRALMGAPKTQVPPGLFDIFRWKSAVWNNRDRTLWSDAMLNGRESFFEVNPNARNVDW